MWEFRRAALSGHDVLATGEPCLIAHFRRVFVANQKFLPWVAKSYLKAAETFDKMGKRQDAVDNLRELLRNEKLQKQPEFEEAKKRLQEWGASA